MLNNDWNAGAGIYKEGVIKNEGLSFSERKKLLDKLLVQTRQDTVREVMDEFLKEPELEGFSDDYTFGRNNLREELIGQLREEYGIKEE